MDITNHIQNSTNAWYRQIPKQNYFNFKMTSIITIAILLMAVALISSSSISNAFADKKSPRDVCTPSIYACNCFNDTENLTATCCQTNAAGLIDCEQCDIDTKTGDYVNCVEFGGKPLDNSKTHGNPPSSGTLGSQGPNSGIMQFNPPNSAKQ